MRIANNQFTPDKFNYTIKDIYYYGDMIILDIKDKNTPDYKLIYFTKKEIKKLQKFITKEL